MLTIDRLPGDAAFGALWDLLQEFPDNNFDDASPATREAFVDLMKSRKAQGENVTMFSRDGALVGAIGYKHLGHGLGILRGIAFARALHGTGDPLRAVASEVARWLTQDEEIIACVYAHNARAIRFLEKVGFVRDEHRLSGAVTQHGKHIDMTVLEIRARQ